MQSASILKSIFDFRIFIPNKSSWYGMKELYEEARRSAPYQYGGQRYYRLKIVSILEFRKESPSTRSIQWIL